MIIPDGIGKTDIVLAIEEWVIGENGERDRKILLRRLIDGITYERLAEEFDMSVRHIKTIVYKRERQIFKHLGF